MEVPGKGEGCLFEMVGRSRKFNARTFFYKNPYISPSGSLFLNFLPFPAEMFRLVLNFPMLKGITLT